MADLLDNCRRIGTGQDLPFLWELHLATMKNYVEQTWGWNEGFQRDHFAKSVSPEKLWILEAAGEPIGALETEIRADHLFFGRIALMPTHHRKGIGSSIIRTVQQQAATLNLPLRLQVLKVNPARNLYERLGFMRDGETATHWLMVCPAPSSSSLRA